LIGDALEDLGSVLVVGLALLMVDFEIVDVRRVGHLTAPRGIALPS
jgi:hypothetical protein